MSRILPSVIDRLVDKEPKIRAEAAVSQSQTAADFQEALRRDLEWLFNTRRPPDPIPPSAVEVRRSVFQYGLPDFTSFSLKTDTDRRRLAQMMETALSNYEPRLSGAMVTVKEIAPGSRVLHFHIEAVLRSEPAPERIFFDAKLELSSTQYKIEGGPGA